MSMRTRYLAGVVLLFSLMTGCRKDSAAGDPVDMGYDYYPDEVGHYVIYEVDSIYLDEPVNKYDTTRYLLKEVIDSVFQDNSGRPTLRLERYWKIYNDTVPYNAMNWSGPRIWTANRTSTGLERKEENRIYLRMVFPVRKGKKWNGNSYNTLPAKDYEIISVDDAESVNGIPFDSVTTVEQFSQINVIEYRYEMEKYARNVGLIYKQRDSIYDGGGPDTVGYLFRQKIVSYGP